MPPSLAPLPGPERRGPMLMPGKVWPSTKPPSASAGTPTLSWKRRADAASLFSGSRSVAAGRARQPSSSACGRAHAQQRRQPPAAPGYNDGVASFPSQHREPLQHHCWSCRCAGGAMEAAPSPSCMKSLRIHVGALPQPQAGSRHARPEQLHLAGSAYTGDRGLGLTAEKGACDKKVKHTFLPHI